MNQLYELKALQDYNKCKEYLKLVRSLEGYNEISFPHCACDAKKEGHVIAIVGISGLKLQACREDGVLENQMIRFDWDELRNWEVDDEGLCFVFQYAKPERKPRSVRIHTPYFVYMNDCFNRITEEKNGTNHVPNSINTNTTTTTATTTTTTTNTTTNNSNVNDTSVVTSTSSTVGMMNDASNYTNSTTTTAAMNTNNSTTSHSQLAPTSTNISLTTSANNNNNTTNHNDSTK